MDPAFWHERWEKGQIGFHQHAFNAHMMAFVARLGIEPNAHVMVPLCGKSRDLLWLRQQGFQVTGVEISSLAVTAFFDENQLKPEITQLAGHRLYRAGRFQIICGDFFDLLPTDLPAVDAVYDRASLIALPPGMRADYVTHLRSLMAPGTRSLLITLDYPPLEMLGPPFAVTEREVHALFAGHYDLEQIHSEDCLSANPRFRDRGLSRLAEQVYLLTLRGGF